VNDKNIQRLIQAAVVYAELAERHLLAEEKKTKILQEAANLARAGDMKAARNKQREADSSPVIFDYTDVHKDLIRAVKPFRKK